MTTHKYETEDAKVTAKFYVVKEAFTNGFAQRVLKLENGITIYIDYDEDEVTIEEEEGK